MAYKKKKKKKRINVTIVKSYFSEITAKTNYLKNI